MKNSSAPDLTLITGGAGFIGTNLADRLLSEGRRVRIFDRLARPGSKHNLEWLRRRHGERLQVILDDVRNAAAVDAAVAGVTQVFHFAAQVAVTTSVDHPVDDFEVNARGTLNLLEALRRRGDAAPLVFTSTNKVYGHLNDVALEQRSERYMPRDDDYSRGFSEERSLDFHSPYGCSKGAAEQYVLDYARTFGLRTAVFRMSCIYGPHQFGNEDQGWVAHFAIRTLRGEPIVLYGDGRQVRDILYVDDLVDAFLQAQARMPSIAGEAFNIGGGATNTVSLLELADLLGEIHGARPVLRFADWRVADQRYYVSDIRHFADATGWHPRVRVPEGVRQLYRWLAANHPEIAAQRNASPVFSSPSPGVLPAPALTRP